MRLIDTTIVISLSLSLLLDFEYLLLSPSLLLTFEYLLLSLSLSCWILNTSFSLSLLLDFEEGTARRSYEFALGERELREKNTIRYDTIYICFPLRFLKTLVAPFKLASSRPATVYTPPTMAHV